MRSLTPSTPGILHKKYFIRRVSLFHCIYTCLVTMVLQAQDILLAFKADPNSWTRVDLILETSSSVNTKLISLNVFICILFTTRSVFSRFLFVDSGA